MENKELQVSPVREIAEVTAEIQELKRQAQAMVLYYVVEIGRRLTEAKLVLPHGEWSAWLKNEVDFSQSTANNYMRLFEEYGDKQITMFGALSNSQTIGNLSYTKALKLLAIPAEEREKFAEEVSANEISVRELEKAIKERDDAIRKAEEEKARSAELEEKLSVLEDAEYRAKEAEKKVTELEQSIKDCVDAARAEEIKKVQEQVAIAEKKALEARLEVKWAKNELAEAKKQLKTANPDVIAFKTLFEDVQSGILKLKGMVDRVRSDDAEVAEKLDAALHALAERL